MKQHIINISIKNYEHRGFHCRQCDDNWGFILSAGSKRKLHLIVDGNPDKWLIKHETT